MTDDMAELTQLLDDLVDAATDEDAGDDRAVLAARRRITDIVEFDRHRLAKVRKKLRRAREESFNLRLVVDDTRQVLDAVRRDLDDHDERTQQEMVRLRAQADSLVQQRDDVYARLRNAGLRHAEPIPGLILGVGVRTPGNPAVQTNPGQPPTCGAPSSFGPSDGHPHYCGRGAGHEYHPAANNLMHACDSCTLTWTAGADTGAHPPPAADSAPPAACPPPDTQMAEFLLARAADDETAAFGWDSDATSRVAAMWTGGDPGYTTVAAAGPGEPWIADGKEVAEPRHVRVLWDPQRNLADAAAKRLLVRAARAADGPEAAGLWRAVAIACDPYAGHPDYQARWPRP